MNIQGRIISNQGISKAENERVILEPKRPNGKERVTGIKTPEGVQEVLNLRTATGRTQLKHAVRDVDKQTGKDIYLRVARTQVIKLHLSESTTRRQLLKQISEVLKQPQSDYDLKFKAGLARVYHTLTKKSSEANQLRYLKNAPIEKLDEKVQALKQEFKKRMPDNQSDKLRHLLRDYQGSTEVLESISSKVFDKRQELAQQVTEFINSANDFKQQDPGLLVKKVGLDVLHPNLVKKLTKENGLEQLKTQLIEQYQTKRSELIEDHLKKIKAEPQKYFNFHEPQARDQVVSDHKGIATKTATRQYEVGLEKFTAQLNKLNAYQLITKSFAEGILTADDFSPNFDSVVKNTALQNVSGHQIYSKYYNKSTDPNPLSDKYHKQTNQLASQQEYVRGLIQIAKDPNRKGISNLQGFPKQMKDLDPVKDLNKVGDDFFRFEREGGSNNLPVKQRVYINVKGDYGPAVMKQIVNLIDAQGDDQEGIQMAKISGPEDAGDRIDTIVVYTSGPEHSQKVVDRLREIQAKGVAENGHLPKIPPNLDIYGSETPGMTERVMPGVALGDEPDEETYKGMQSFGSLRSETMARVAYENRHQNLSFEQFHAKVESELRKALINPDRVDRNLV